MFWRGRSASWRNNLASKFLNSLHNQIASVMTRPNRVNAPLRTRRERAQQLRETHSDFFGRYGPEARQILEDLLEKYAVYGDAQFVLPDVLKVPPLSAHGQVGDIVRLFGGADELRDAVNELQRHLYAA